jgi:hypothetical protein
LLVEGRGRMVGGSEVLFFSFLGSLICWGCLASGRDGLDLVCVELRLGG